MARGLLWNGGLALALILLLGVPDPALGQAVGSNARISGTVTDSTGAVIPGASVDVEEINSGAQRATTANAVGFYSLDEVPVGSYRLTAVAEGFSNKVISPIELSVKQRVDLTIVLTPGTVVETVEVTGAALRLETQSSDVGGTVTGQILKQLPTRVRNPMELVHVVPGVTNSFVQGTGGGYYGANFDGKGGIEVWSTNNFSVAGGHRTNAVIMLDGIDVRSDNGGGTSQNVILSPDFIEEFRVQVNNYSPEYGQGAGVVNLVTKSGTNEFHGTVFNFLQNDNINANLFFNNSRGIGKPEFKRNQYGYAVGGPIAKNKLWFMHDLERLRQRGPRSEVGRVPTANEERGDFSGIYGGADVPVTLYNPFDTYMADGRVMRRPFSNNMIPASFKDSSGFIDNLIPYWPDPTRTGDLTGGGLPTNANNWAVNVGSLFDYDRLDLKLDYQPGNDHRVSWRFSRNTQFIPNVDLYGNIASPFLSGSITRPTTEWQATHTWMVTPTFIINSAFYYYWGQHIIPNPSQGFDPTPLGGPFADGSIVSAASSYNTGTSFPAIRPAGYQLLGTDSGFSGRDRRYQYAIGVSQIKGKHQFKYGAQMKPGYSDAFGENDRALVGRYDFSGGFTSGPDPLTPTAFTGNGFADLYLGLIDKGEFVNHFQNHAKAGQYAWYFEDTWKVSDRLTLNLGVRYDFSQPGAEVNDQNVKFDPFYANPVGELRGPNTGGGTVNDALGRPVMGAFLFATSPEFSGRRITDTDFSNISPRIGAAYRLNEKTVLRGGFAKLYWLTTYRALFSPSTNPFSAKTPVVGTVDGINPAVTIDNWFPNGIAAPVGKARGPMTDVGGALSGGVGGQKNPYSWQWNFGIQRELPGNALITVSYLGSMARRLPCPFFFCGAGVGEDVLKQLGPRLLESVPNPFYGITDPSGRLNPNLALINQKTVQRKQLMQDWPHYTYGSGLYIPPPASNSGFGLFTEEYPFKNSWHGMTLGYEKRYSDGIQLNVAYTMGKNLTNADSFEAGYLGPTIGYQNPRDISQEKSLSAEDTNYRLVISHVYDVPLGRGSKVGRNWHPVADAVVGGWQLSGVWTFQSGFPLPITVSPNNINHGWGQARPNMTSDARATTGSRGARIQQWVDPGSFSHPPPFTLGNASRLLNGVRGDGIKNFDVSLIKFFRISEDMNVEFRAEFFNLFNRPQFANPNMAFGSANFGLVSSTTGPSRYVQFGLKFNF